MGSVLFILNEAPYGSERTYNSLRLAGAIAMGDQPKVAELAQWTLTADKVLVF